MLKLDVFAKAWPYHPLDMPDEQIREIIAHYYGMVSMVDHNVGRILEALDRLNLSATTVVLYATDHGEHLGDHWLIYKCAPYDECSHVPMLWRWPGQFAAGSRVDGLVSHIDVMPTALELAGVPVSRGVQGESYAANGLQSRVFAGRPYILSEDDDLAYPPNTGGWLRTLRTPQHRILYYLPEKEGEIYYLNTDPHEFYNCCDGPDYRAVREDLMRKMLEVVICAT